MLHCVTKPLRYYRLNIIRSTNYLVCIDRRAYYAPKLPVYNCLKQYFRNMMFSEFNSGPILQLLSSAAEKTEGMKLLLVVMTPNSYCTHFCCPGIPRGRHRLWQTDTVALQTREGLQKHCNKFHKHKLESVETA